MRKFLVWAIFGSLGMLLVPVTGHTHQAPKRCNSDGVTFTSNLKAHGHVGCKVGRRLAQRWVEWCYFSGADCSQTGRKRYFGVEKGFVCRHRAAPNHYWRVRCRGSGGIVHFKARGD